MGRSPCCDKVGLKKGPWTPEEDQKLLAYIEEHGHGSWRALPVKAGLQRCGKSCRLRWTNYLRPDIKRGKFSMQEEQTIIQLHALLGNRWSAIATHLPKRTDNEIKNYWNTHLKKRLAKLGIDPITHKPKSDALLSTDAQSKSAANLSHMAQWESARLEAEARLVRESKLRSHSHSHSFQHRLTRPPTAAFASSAGQLVNKTAWNSTAGWSKSSEVNNGVVNNGFGDLESPKSTLTSSENGVGLSSMGMPDFVGTASASFFSYFPNSPRFQRKYLKISTVFTLSFPIQTIISEKSFLIIFKSLFSRPKAINMGQEVKMRDFEANGGDDEEATANAITTIVDDDDDDVEERVIEWEMGLPNCDDLTPLSQSLIPPELASAFSISPEPRRTTVDVNRASRNTLSSLRSTGAHSSTTNNNNSNSNFRDTIVVEAEGYGSGSGSGSDPKKMRKMDIAEEADSAVRTTENSDDPSGRTLKRQRLVWTPQLHKRFVDVVAHLGIKSAVPKTIMQLMNVEGLTRENVASHLQKYRLYLKRMQGLSNEGPSASDQLFASTPVPQSLHETGSGGGGGGGGGGSGGAGANGNGHLGMAIPMPYGAPMMPVPMPMCGHVGMHQGLYHQQRQHHHQNGYEANSYGMMQQRDWSGGNRYGSQ